jgi:hypothetical protein
VSTTLEGRLVVAISSRALFDFEEENRVFEANDDRAYMQLQLQRLEQPARPGVAFSLVNKLLAFNRPSPLGPAGPELGRSPFVAPGERAPSERPRGAQDAARLACAAAIDRRSKRRRPLHSM